MILHKCRIDAIVRFLRSCAKTKKDDLGLSSGDGDNADRQTQPPGDERDTT